MRPLRVVQYNFEEPLFVADLISYNAHGSGRVARGDYDILDSSDDWATPHNVNNIEDINDDDVIHFGDSDREDVLESRFASLGCRSVVGARPKYAKEAATNALRLSHPASAAHDNCEDPRLQLLFAYSPMPDHDNSFESTLQADNTSSHRARSVSPGLFVSEDEPTLVIKGKTELNAPDNTLRKLPYMDGLKRARAVKAEIENNISVLKPLIQQSSTRHRVEDNPENQLIKTLRTEQNMNWAEIANFLNQERRNRGEAANFTAPAIYSRYVCSVPRVATTVGEIGFDPKDYMHLRHPNQYTAGEGTGIISKAGKKRVKNYDNAKELEANVRKQVSEDSQADLETAEKTELLMEAVAKVERNFWVFVADEMERSTTKLYPPQALAGRYHSI